MSQADENSISTSDITNKKKNMLWKTEEEDILKEWADKSLCFRWLHAKSHRRYNKFYAALTIPVIILSTITGTANFAQERFPPSHQNLIVMVIGSLNIIAGIITTIGQFLKVAELNEGHRVAALAWGKYSRSLKIQLARQRDDRTGVYNLMKRSQEEYDRLLETSPPIPQKIIKDFMKMVVTRRMKEQKESGKMKKRRDRMNKLDFSLPEICGEIHGTKVYSADDEKNELPDDMHNESILEIEKIENYKRRFKQIHSRYPTNDEINEVYCSPTIKKYLDEENSGEKEKVDDPVHVI